MSEEISLKELAYLQTINDYSMEINRLKNALNYEQLLNQQLLEQLENMEEKEDVQGNE